MRRCLSIAAFLAATGAHAMPPAEDEFARFVAEHGILEEVGEVSQGVADPVRTSSVVDKASDLVVTAMAFLGVPYRRGGSTIEGFDCSGFVKAIYEQAVGAILPRRANEQAAATQQIDRSELQPGDLVFFNTMRRAFSHVGIYIGEGKFIHSPRPGASVRVEDMRLAYWSRRFDGARRVLLPEQAAAAGQ